MFSKKIIALFCVLLLSVTALTFGACATDDVTPASSSDLVLVLIENEQPSQAEQSSNASLVTFAASLAALEFAVDETTEIRIPDLLSKTTDGTAAEIKYTQHSIFVDDMLVGDVMDIRGITYVPVAEFLTATGIEYTSSWNDEENTAIFDLGDFTITLIDGTNYIEVNGRVLQTADIMNIDGTIIASVNTLAYCFGFGLTYEDNAIRVDTSTLNYLASGDEFYVEEDLYWLSRIIHAEAGNQPLDGRIGVGNVVLNRVEDPSCPDTIYGVIFDNTYGVQFSVTENGTIYLEPAELSIVAAKLCLEGRNVVGDSMYFVNPDIGVSSWFRSTREYITSIGEHDFYS